MTTRRGIAKSLALLVALAASPAAVAVQPEAVVDGALSRKSGQSIFLDARKSVSEKPLRWKLLGSDRPFLTFDAAPRKAVYLFLPDAEDGVYNFALTAVGKVGDELEADTAVVQVVVGDPAPSPTPPAPTPTPTPTPTPPGPNPPPTPPSPVVGFRVLLVAEPTAKMSRGQLVVLNSTKVVDYLNRKTVKGADGRASWRKFDPDVDVANELPEWKEIWTATKPTLGQLPVVVLFSGQAGKAYPLPETEAAMLELLRSYGGP